jgi:DNA gyrase inhibitor GyrI
MDSSKIFRGSKDKYDKRADSVFSQFLYESGRETSNYSFRTTGLRSPPPDAHHTYELYTGSCNMRSKKN